MLIPPAGVRPALSFPAPSTYISQFRLSPCLLIIPIHSISSSSRTTSPLLLLSDRLLTVVSGVRFSTNLTAYYFHHIDKQQWAQVAPTRHANSYFKLSWYSRSTQHPALCVFICPFYLPDLCLWDATHVNDAIAISLDMESQPLSRSMNSVVISSCPFSFFSFVANVPLVVPLPFLNPHCPSPISPSTLLFFLPY